MKLLFLKKNSLFLFFLIVLSLIILLLFSNHYKIVTLDVSSNITYYTSFHDRLKSLTSNSEKIAYLTFDDGPSKYATNRILDILKEENVKATFFVVGKYVKEYPEVTKRAFLEGHYIANHGYNHDNNLLYSSKDSFINEIKKTDFEIGSAIGIPDYCSHVFRFPNGYMSPNNKYAKKKAAKLLESLDYSYIDWNCLNNDSVHNYSKEELLSNLKKTAKGKNTLVILMHDTTDRSDSSKALKDSINFLRSQGYSFKNFYFN